MQTFPPSPRPRGVSSPLSEDRLPASLIYRQRTSLPRGASDQCATSDGSPGYVQDNVLVEREDFFVFPGTDQILLCFQLQGETPDNLDFVLTDKVGIEKARVPLSGFQKVICDYTATLNNPFNFNVKWQNVPNSRQNQ